jgi:nitrogen PTS system EIIA component
MIRITSKLADGAVATDVHCANKAAILDKIADMAAKTYGFDRTAVQEGLDERERLGPTGFGGGTAIPHCKVAGLSAPIGVFLQLDKPVAYDAVDDMPVDLIFGLISPANDGASHLRALAEVSRMFRDEKSCRQLRGAADAAALYALLALSEERDAA